MKYTITPWYPEGSTPRLLGDDHFEAADVNEAILMYVSASVDMCSLSRQPHTEISVSWDDRTRFTFHLPSWMVEFMPRVSELPIFEWIKGNISVQQYEDAKSRARVRKLAALKVFSDATALDLAKVAENYPDLRDVTAEALAAAVERTNRFGKFFTAHDGFAKLSEELDELKEHVNMREDSRDLEKMRSEAMDVVVVGIRFVAYACDEIVGRR